MAEKKTYTDEQKAEILKYAADTTVTAASRQYGVSAMTINRWKKAGQVTAEAIEVKKTVRSAGRKAKEKVAATKEKAAGKAAAKKEDRKEVKTAVKATADDKKTAVKIEAKKNVRKAGKKVSDKAEAVKEAAAKPAAKHAAAKMNLVFQSQAGGAISYEQIAAKVPAGTTDAYVKIEENKIYWVGKDGSTGSVEIW